MKGKPTVLTSKQETAIVALLTNATLSGAAKACNVSETTLWRWQKEELFHREYLLARHQTIENAVGLLQKATGAASATMINLMKDEAVAASTRLSAARSVMEYALKSLEVEILEVRVKALEEAYEVQDERIKGWRR